MRHRLLAGVLLVAAGCAGTQYYRPPQERLPAPADAGGTAVAVEDRRPEWERQPFTGAICLYHPGKARPNPWDGVAREARDAATTLPDRPERVTVGARVMGVAKERALLVSFSELRSGGYEAPFADAPIVDEALGQLGASTHGYASRRLGRSTVVRIPLDSGEPRSEA